MDVEKRMALSLDQIIKQKSGKGKQEAQKGPGKKGRGKVKIAKLSGQNAKGKGQAAKGGNQVRPAKQNLGVQKQGMKVQKAKRRGTAPSEPRSGKGKKVVALGKSSDRRGGPSGLSRKDSGRVKDGKAKRTVDLPRLSDLRITISNEKAASQPYPISSLGAPGFQPGMYASQPLWTAAPSQAMQAPSYGFGPRNMQPGGSSARAAPNYPVPRPRMDYGVSRKTLGGSEPYVPRRAYKDYDDPSQNKSYMRMDTR